MGSLVVAHAADGDNLDADRPLVAEHRVHRLHGHVGGAAMAVIVVAALPWRVSRGLGGVEDPMPGWRAPSVRAGRLPT